MSIWSLIPISLMYSILLYKLSKQEKEIKFLKGNIKHIEEYLKKF